MPDNYLIENVISFDPAQCSNNTLLVVHKLHRTPYHIGLIHEDRYFSLTINGPEFKTRNEMLDELSNKAYNNLVIEIKNIAVSADVQSFFEKSKLNHVQFLSCLFPVRDFLTSISTNNKVGEANNLFELLDALNEANLVGVKMATRMTPIMESKIVLQRYDTADIARYIKKLNESKTS